MRIGIDLRFTASSCMGTGTYAETIALALGAAMHAGDVLVGFTEQDLGDTRLARVASQRLLPRRIAGSSPVDAQRLVFDSAIERERLDVFLAPAGIGPRIASCPVVTTAHDLLFESHPELFGEPLLRYLSREVPRSLRAADLVLAVSTSTKDDAQRCYRIPDERIRVMHQPLRESMRTAPPAAAIAAARTELGIDGPYLLTLTNHAPHKNTVFLLGVFADWLRRSGDASTRLVIAGGGPAPHAPVDLRAIAIRLGIAERILITGRVAEPHLPGLLAGATAFLFPSLHEGWGLPPLEAMAVGTPVIVSDRGGLPEAIGDAGIVLPIEATEPWVAALAQLVAHGLDQTRREAMRRRTSALTEPCGELLRACLVDVVDRHGRRRPLPAFPSRSDSNAAPTQPPSVSHRRGLSGCMIIRNGVRLGYPFVEAIHAVIDHVDEMVVVDGCSDDETWTVLSRMAEACPTLRISQEPWPSTTRGGRVIAEATNHAMRLCRQTHILYVQADEIHTRRNLVRLRELLDQGADYAAMPFLHFRSSWWTILENPAYTATIRCVPNHPNVQSVDDGTTFRGPPAPCAPPEAFPEAIFHVGWVYAPNILAKHRNHAELYRDHVDYQVKAASAAALSDRASASDLEQIDPEYRLQRFQGRHPEVIAHLIDRERYDYQDGLRKWLASRSEKNVPTASRSPRHADAAL